MHRSVFVEKGHFDRDSPYVPQRKVSGRASGWAGWWVGVQSGRWRGGLRSSCFKAFLHLLTALQLSVLVAHAGPCSHLDHTMRAYSSHRRWMRCWCWPPGSMRTSPGWSW